MDAGKRQAVIKPGVDMIAVEWEDAFWDESYYDLDEIRSETRNLLRILSIGCLVSEDDKVVILAQEWQSRWRRFKHLVGIPKVSIIRQKRWKLRMANTRHA